MVIAALPESPTLAKPARSHLRLILPLAVIARILFAAHLLLSGPPEPATSLLSWNFEDIFIAVSLLHGRGFSSPFNFPSGPTAILAPGYPLLLAGLIRFVGTGRFAVWAVISFQIILSILIIPLIMWLARKHFGTRTANLTGFIYAVAQPMLVLPVYIWDTALSALLLTAAVVIASRPRWHSSSYSIMTGAGCAFATLVNPTLLASLWAVFGWSAWRARVAPWLALLTFLVVFSPWPIRNLRVMHSFIPFRSTMNFELWEGNHPGADGNVAPDLWPMTSQRERDLYLANGEVAYMRRDGSLFREYFSTHKSEFVKLTIKRFVRFWDGSGTGSPGPMTVMLAVLAISGVALAWGKWRVLALLLLPIAIYPLPFYITHPNVRYQFVIDPSVAIFAAYAVECFFAWCSRTPLPSPSISSAAD